MKLFFNIDFFIKLAAYFKIVIRTSSLLGWNVVFFIKKVHILNLTALHFFYAISFLLRPDIGSGNAAKQSSWVNGGTQTGLMHQTFVILFLYLLGVVGVLDQVF